MVSSAIAVLMDTEHAEHEGKRARLIIDLVEEHDRLLNEAVQLRASKRSVTERRRVSKSEVVTKILHDALATELDELRQFQSQQKKPKKK